jgi:hypothetical protein
MNKPRKENIMNEPTESPTSTDPSVQSAQSVVPPAQPQTENEKHLTRFNAIAGAAKLLAVEVRNSAEYTSHYLQEGNREAAITAYQRLREKLNEAHQILTEQFKDWPQ